MPPFLRYRRALCSIGISLSAKGLGDLVGHLVDAVLQLALEHHLHHKVEVGVKGELHANVVGGYLLELYPEEKLEGDFAVAGKLKGFVGLLLHELQAYVEAFYLKVAGVFVGLPVGHLPVGHHVNQPIEVAEIRERVEYELGAVADGYYFAFYFCHDSLLSPLVGGDAPLL